MIKRPLVWVLGAYMAGMYIACGSVSIWIVFLIMLLTCLVLYLLMFRVTKKYINRYDSFLWFLPILLLLGFTAMEGRMKPSAADLAFQEKAECRLEGEVAMIVEKQSCRVLYVTENVIWFSDERKYLCENVIVYCSDKQKYLKGNKITVHGKIHKFTEDSNPGQFNEKKYYQSQNINYKIMAVKICIIDYGYSKFYKILSCIKEKLILVYDRILDNREFGVLIAMLLGEKYLINEEIRELYQKNGISHILSISGLHISLIAMYVFIFLKKLKIPVTPAALLSILFIYSYGAFTNFSISTNRSVVMMTLLFFAKVIGKTYDMLSAISLSAFLILLNSPLQIFNTGFLLSFGAVMGIGIVFPCLQALFPTKNRIFNSLLISISAQILIVPVILVFYYQFPLYSVIINLFLLPALSVLLITAVIAGIAGVIYLPAGIFCIGGVNYILKFYEWVCIWGCKIPGNLITTGKPDKICILLYFILLGIFVWGVKCYSRKEFIILPAVSLLMLLPQGTDGLTITMLDVGQGESICMQAENKTYLIDCGSTDIKNVGIYRLTPFLLSNGVDKIDYAMFTHSDYDHISGIREIIKKGRIKISHLVLPKIKVKDEVYSEFEALTGEKKIMLQYIKAGDFIQDGRLRIICLHPLAEHQLLSANDNSMVLSVSYGDFDMLLTGDIEADGEKQLIEQLQNKSGRTEYVYKPVSDYDILKVSHHGSKSSTSEAFLQIVRPEAALISCGKNNSYGHPHKELLERLLRIGCHVRITYETGAVTIKTDGNKLKISNFIRESDLE